MFDVITVGSATIDVFVDTGVRETGTDVKNIQYPVGSKILIRKMDQQIGGGGTNTAVAFSRLGLKTAFLGKVGNDDNGKRILDLLRKENVKFIGTVGKEMSGYSVILNSAERNRTILTYKGANDNLHFDEIKKKKIKTKWFYFSSMLNESFETQKKLANFAEKNNIKIAFNPSEYHIKKGVISLKGIFKKTEILFVNKKEAELLSKEKNIKKIFKKLHSFGPKIVCITQADKDAMFFDGKVVYTLTPHKIKVLERTGAGDAFGSGFVAGMVKKNKISFALQLALANSESVVRHYGAKNKLLTWKEALKKIKTNPGKIRKVIIK